MKSKTALFVCLISLMVYLLLPAVTYGRSLPVGDLSELSYDTGEEEQLNDDAADSNKTTKPSYASAVLYQISEGDTLFKIAKAFGISVQELITDNGITNPGFIRAGQRIRISIQDGSLQLPVSADGDLLVIKKVLTSTLTAYTAGFESTGKRPGHPEYGITYSGSKAQEGRTIAVDPAAIPLGSTVYINGVGMRTAEDTGSAIRGSRIDVFINNLVQARNFGVKPNVKVFVL